MKLKDVDHGKDLNRKALKVFILNYVNELLYDAKNLTIQLNSSTVLSICIQPESGKGGKRINR